MTAHRRCHQQTESRVCKLLYRILQDLDSQVYTSYESSAGEHSVSYLCQHFHLPGVCLRKSSSLRFTLPTLSPPSKVSCCPPRKPDWLKMEGKATPLEGSAICRHPRSKSGVVSESLEQGLGQSAGHGYENLTLDFNHDVKSSLFHGQSSSCPQCMAPMHRVNNVSSLMYQES